jgi:hypothetical protein
VTSFAQQFGMWLFGGAFIIAGVLARFGLWKGWYWRSPGSAYGYVPLGSLFVAYSFNAQAREMLAGRYWIYELSALALLVIGVWWSMRPPEFVKPAWVRRVEDYPAPDREAMAQAVADGADWEPNVVSAEALEAWVVSLRPKKSRAKRSKQT